MKRISCAIRVLLPLSAATVVLLLQGCGKGNFSQKVSAGKERIFRYSLVTNPTHVDPALVQDGDTIDITQQIFEGLVKWSEENTVVPNLAEKWEISDGGKTYVFHLMKGVTFSNGKALTANDFKYAIERSCDPALRSQTAEEYLGDIVGVKERVHGHASSVSGVEVVDDNTLKIRIDKPKPYFLGKLTYPVSFAVNKDATPLGKEMLNPSSMIGTGPFVATRYIEDQTFDMSANKTYHGGAPLIDGIERPILKDAATRLNKYKAGEVDLIQLERQDVAALQADSTYKSQLKFFLRPATWYLAFNTKVYPPFADKRIRQAFSMAINKDAIVQQTLGGINQIANSILPPQVLGYRASAKTLPYDPARAKALLASAGYADGSTMPSLELYYRSDREDVKLVVESVQSDLKKNLSVQVSPRPLEWSTYLDKNNRRALPFYHMRWSADYLDPQNFLSTLLTTNGPENKQNYSNPAVDQLCSEADVLPEKSLRRLELYAKAEDQILEDAAWLPIYFQKDAELISPRVSGLRESAFGHLPHTKVKLTN